MLILIKRKNANIIVTFASRVTRRDKRRRCHQKDHTLSLIAFFFDVVHLIARNNAIETQREPSSHENETEWFYFYVRDLAGTSCDFQPRVDV